MFFLYMTGDDMDGDDSGLVSIEGVERAGEEKMFEVELCVGIE
jgi:hypothetical protein